MKVLQTKEKNLWASGSADKLNATLFDYDELLENSTRMRILNK